MEPPCYPMPYRRDPRSTRKWLQIISLFLLFAGSFLLDWLSAATLYPVFWVFVLGLGGLLSLAAWSKRRNRFAWRYYGVFVLALLSIILTGVFSCPLSAQEKTGAQNPTADRVATANLLVVLSGGVERTGATTYRRDFGQRDRLVTASLQHTFILFNNEDKQITIRSVETSCGCTSVLLGGAGQGTTITLEPSEKTELQVTVDLARLSAGPQKKYLTCYVEGQPTPALTIEIRLFLPPTVTFSAPTLDFGRISAGKEVALPLTATLDARLVADGKWPPLVCTHPDIRVQPGAPTLAADKKTAERTYTIILPASAPLGLLRGTLLFQPIQGQSPPSPAAGGKPAESSPQPLALVGTAAVPLTAEVLGKITASPSALIFGTVKAGQEATRQIVVNGVSAAALKGLQASSSQTWLAVRLLPPPRTSASEKTDSAHPGTLPPALILEAKLNSKRPAGPLQCEVTLTTNDGQRLILSVIGFTVNEAK